jgi:hypothetical protein
MQRELREHSNSAKPAKPTSTILHVLLTRSESE